MSAKWNEQPCPHCKRPIAYDAKVCPRCSFELSEKELAERKTKHRGGIGCAAVIVLALFFWIWSCNSGGKTTAVERTATAADRAAVKTFYSTIVAKAGNCDADNKLAMDAVSKLGSGGSAYSAYPLVKNAKASCEAYARDLATVTVPDVPAKAKDKLDSAIDNCGAGSISRVQTLDTAMQILDGDMKPSTLTAFKESGNASQAGMLGCVADIYAAADAVGLKADELTR